MSVRVFFSFSTGLAVTLTVPAGTKQALLAHVEEVESILGLKRSKYKDNPVHWDHWDPEYRAGFPKVTDELLCETVESHNDWVRYTYRRFEEWSAHPVEGGEEITPEDATLFWHGFQELHVPPRRWTADYYRARMESLYEVMRGRESEGASFDVKALTPVQASAVIRIFEPYLDSHDLRLEAPHGHDYLASSYDGGYSWCDKCFRAMTPDDGACCRRRKCPLADR
jgi:hypothetical protein